jgi:hypothetical protein
MYSPIPTKEDFSRPQVQSNIATVCNTPIRFRDVDYQTDASPKASSHMMHSDQKDNSYWDFHSPTSSPELPRRWSLPSPTSSASPPATAGLSTKNHWTQNLHAIGQYIKIRGADHSTDRNVKKGATNAYRQQKPRQIYNSDTLPFELENIPKCRFGSNSSLVMYRGDDTLRGLCRYHRGPNPVRRLHSPCRPRNK